MLLRLLVSVSGFAALSSAGCGDGAHRTIPAVNANREGAELAKPKDAPQGMTTPPNLKDVQLEMKGMKFVPLPKGTFYMGWDKWNGSAKKTDINEDFEIGVYTVTQGLWQAVMGKNPSYFSRTSPFFPHLKRLRDSIKEITDEELKRFPVESVSWDDCQEFIEKLNEVEKGNGWVYRLPREAEWEYACRGGATSEEDCSYCFYLSKPTNDLSSKDANFDGEFPGGNGEKGSFLKRTTTVGSYAPNKLGLYDMHGNVWQWCDELETPNGSRRVLRGGCYGISGGGYCAAGYRSGATPSLRYSDAGLRLVRVPSPR